MSGIGSRRSLLRRRFLTLNPSGQQVPAFVLALFAQREDSRPPIAIAAASPWRLALLSIAAGEIPTALAASVSVIVGAGAVGAVGARAVKPISVLQLVSCRWARTHRTCSGIGCLVSAASTSAASAPGRQCSPVWRSGCIKVAPQLPSPAPSRRYLRPCSAQAILSTSALPLLTSLIAAPPRPFG